VPPPTDLIGELSMNDAPLELIERELCEYSAQLAAGKCRWLLMVGTFDAREGWAQWGTMSCAHWLSWRCGIAPRSAREHVRVARKLRELPLLVAAFSNGQLSYSKVRAITRIATPANEDFLVSLALHGTGAHMDRIVRKYRGVLAANTDTAKLALEHRFLYFTDDGNGSLLIHGRVPIAEGQLLRAAIEHAMALDNPAEDGPAEPAATPQDGPAEPAATPEDGPAEPAATPEDGPAEPAATPEDGPAEPPVVAGSGSAEPPCARRADALIEIARTELASDPSHPLDGDPIELTVHIDATSLTQDTIHERSEFANGPPIAPETARRLGCDSSIVRTIERDGKPLTSSRRKRRVSAALRRLLRDRDPRCRFPGCEHTRYLHAHHITHWIKDGPTTLDNLIHLCSHHHRLVHEGGYTVRHAEDGQLRFARPNGLPIPQHPILPAARGPGIKRQNAVRGIAIDADTCMPLSAGDPIDYGLTIEGLLYRDLGSAEQPLDGE
jgi:hypothetical protein